MSEPITENELKSTSTSALTELVEETEELLTNLKAELKRREEAAQHQAIDGLEEHMANAQISLSKVREFFELMLQELRGNK